MHLFESTLQLLQILRDDRDIYFNMCQKENKVFKRFRDLPHEVITFLLYNIRFQKSGVCSLEFLFLEFIRLGYNPFRPDASYKERLMIKSVIAVIDKTNGHNHENKKKN